MGIPKNVQTELSDGLLGSNQLSREVVPRIYGFVLKILSINIII